MSKSLPKPKIYYRHIDDLLKNNPYTPKIASSPSFSQEKSSRGKSLGSGQKSRWSKSTSRHSLTSKQKVKYFQNNQSITKYREQASMIKDMFSRPSEDKRYQNYCAQVDTLYSQMEHISALVKATISSFNPIQSYIHRTSSKITLKYVKMPQRNVSCIPQGQTTQFDIIGDSQSGVDIIRVKSQQQCQQVKCTTKKEKESSHEPSGLKSETDGLLASLDEEMLNFNPIFNIYLTMKIVWALIAIFLLLIMAMTETQLQKMVDEHFFSYDVNKNGLLQRSEYSQKLREEDQAYAQEISQEGQDYYWQLTSLLYSQYDSDNDGNLSLQQWRSFSIDIMDQSSEQYKELQKDPRMKGVEAQL